MKKSKTMETLDRLSELPNSLIFAIFERLPMRTVARTTVLSKRWRNLWTTVPYLNFIDNGKPESFITRALMFWRGTRILKFKIGLSADFDGFTDTDIDLWLRFAKDYEVRELYLHLVVFSDSDEDEELYPVPQFLFSSCPSLQVLTLIGCETHIDRDVKWGQLKSLTIKTENGLREADIDRILRGSPRLEVLVLRFYDNSEHLTVRSSSLKKLSIDKFVEDCDDEATEMNTRLIISTPNLETLEISNVPYSYCSFENVSSLTDVSLLFDDCDNVEEALKQILPRIQHVENVTLSYYTIMALEELEKKHLTPKSWNVIKFLKIKACFSAQRCVVVALEIFSKVEMLVLEDVSLSVYEEEKSYLEFRPSLPNLRRVEVTWGKLDYAMFPLLEILLKYASNLETMVFRAKAPMFSLIRPASEAFSYAAEKLLKMPGCSPTMKLILCDKDYCDKA